jgi:site-specific DNA-methyltransferase (adenine-specific)
MDAINKLYFGDNLQIMREHISDESIDLIYLDPPFNSKATYNVLFDEKNGTHSRAQITAFEDTWHWGIESEEAYHEIVTQGPKKLADLIQALRSFLGQNDMMAYLTMMAIRLVEMHRVLKSTGSIYLHCDPTASHYLKIVMDGIFSAFNFTNEIIWKRTSGHSDATRYGNVHDTILFYTKTDKPVWNKVFQKYDPDYVENYYRYIDDDGRRFKSGDLSAYGLQGGGYEYEWNGHKKIWRCPKETMQRLDNEGKIYYTKNGVPRLKQYLDEAPGMPPQDMWTDIQSLRSWHQERLSYPTQKPEALLERIIEASSNEDDMVMDPFCGCGTTIAAAEKLNRKWIGIDITHLAITLMKHRLNTAFGKDLSPYEVIGDPKDLQGAKALAEHDRFQFEWWALGKVAARPAQDKKKGADSGVDGYIYFFDDNSGKAKKIIVQVKSGNVKRGDIATLKGDMEREKAMIGAFITLEEPTRPMTEEAVSAGFYEPELLHGKKYPKIQILTIKESLEGKILKYPRIGIEGTFKNAKRKTKTGEQGKLL